ncbi:M28 family metallopeptidase [Streptomyces sp. DT24]|uniref:M28 family metallopeptidase n=1 Tax=unclassified Streptomyces TaxID=2593676 RepID=UPI0023B9F2C6|nr:M28 family metallopeptidase [Streptomyces sp. AM 4-1-1]WEH35124.1 M28 family metallopeptidase [Streptomyces sp. AM 4-1-1]
MKSSNALRTTLATCAAAGLVLSLTTGAQASAPHTHRTHKAAPDISVKAVQKHLYALQKIADRNGGHRAHGSAGYQQSLDYVKGILDRAGFKTSVQEFEFGGKKSYNLLADWPKGGNRHGETLMVGAHLDSVDTSPGINDNGSAVAAVLETALAVSKGEIKPNKHLRFAWWGTEEETFIGSTYYVDHLTPAERGRISAYVNFDMIASPNPGYFVYDQDAEIEGLFKDFFRRKGIDTEPATALDGRSDHESFRAKGIRVGGTFTGSAEIKTAAQVRKWGGTADEAMDKCYHLACDTPANINKKALDLNSDAMAYVVTRLSS